MQLRKQKLPQQRLFLFNPPNGSILYIEQDFFRRMILRGFQRGDMNLSRSDAVTLAQELVQMFYGESVSEQNISCELPYLVQEQGVFRRYVLEIAPVKVSVTSNTALPAYQQYLKTLVQYPYITSYKQFAK